jgi:hypothetical protein
MSLSTRLTRAGLAFLVLGAIATVVPSTGVASADGLNCSSGTNGAAIAAGVLGAGVIYGATSGLFVAGSNDKKKKNSQLDTFTYPADVTPK